MIPFFPTGEAVEKIEVRRMFSAALQSNRAFGRKFVVVVVVWDVFVFAFEILSLFSLEGKKNYLNQIWPYLEIEFSSKFNKCLYHPWQH